MQVYSFLRSVLLLTVMTLVSVLPLQAQNDPAYVAGQQPYLQAIKADRAWAITKGSSSTKIAVIGVGSVLATHEDLGGKLTTVQNRLNINLEPATTTASAGVAAALTNNGKGIAGIDWNARLLAYDTGILLQDTNGQIRPGIDIEHWDNDIRNAMSRGAQIILAPFTAFSDDPPRNYPYHPDATVTYPSMNVKVDWWGWARKLGSLVFNMATQPSHWNSGLYAFRDAYKAGHTIITQAGDFDGVIGGIPAGLADDYITISVGGVRNDGSRYTFSANAGSAATPERTNLDVVTPIENVHTTLNSAANAYGSVNTTAASAGMVAGVAGLMKALNPNLEPDDIKQILRRTAQKVGNQTGFDRWRGFGRVNVEAALNYVQSRSFVHGTATSGSKTRVADNQTMSLWSSGWNVTAPGIYIYMDKYRVRFTVPKPSGVQDPHIWIRYDDTCGWSPDNPNDQSRYARIVSQTSSTITFETWIYEGYDELGNYMGWMPCQNATVGYTIAHTGTISPPPAPSNLTITNAMTDGQSPHLTWNAVSGATSYKVYRCYDDPGNSINECSNDANWTYVLTTSNTSAYDYAVTMQSYCYMTGQGTWKMARYRVTAIRDGQESNPSSQASTCTNQQASKTAPLAELTVQEALPEQFVLHSNYPNPFNPSTDIRFDLPEAAHVRLVVYDVLGREVARLVDREMEAGYQHVTWEAGQVPSGVYLYRIEAGSFSQSRSMILQK